MLSQKSRLDEHILLPEQVAAVLQIDLEDTVVFVDFLEDRGYIRCGRPVGSYYSWIKLTSKGMDLVSDPTNLETVFKTNTEDHHPTILIGHSTLQKLAGGTDVSEDVLSYIDNALSEVVHALHHGDDAPLRHFLSELILRGGIDTTAVGVEALLVAYGIPS